MLGREAVLPAEDITGHPSADNDSNSHADEDQYATAMRDRLAKAHDVARRNLYAHAVYQKRCYVYDLKARKQSLKRG